MRSATAAPATSAPSGGASTEIWLDALCDVPVSDVIEQPSGVESAGRPSPTAVQSHLGIPQQIGNLAARQNALGDQLFE
jgi:hypothetical protein